MGKQQDVLEMCLESRRSDEKRERRRQAQQSTTTPFYTFLKPPLSISFRHHELCRIRHDNSIRGAFITTPLKDRRR